MILEVFPIFLETPIYFRPFIGRAPCHSICKNELGSARIRPLCEYWVGFSGPQHFHTFHVTCKHISYNIYTHRSQYIYIYILYIYNIIHISNYIGPENTIPSSMGVLFSAHLLFAKKFRHARNVTTISRQKMEHSIG